MCSKIGIFQWKKIEKDSDDFWHWKFSFKVEFLHFLTPPPYNNFQNSMISFQYVDFYAKILVILYTPLKTLTTRITITQMNGWLHIASVYWTHK